MQRNNTALIFNTIIDRNPAPRRSICGRRHSQTTYCTRNRIRRTSGLPSACDTSSSANCIVSLLSDPTARCERNLWQPKLMLVLTVGSATVAVLYALSAVSAQGPRAPLYYGLTPGGVTVHRRHVLNCSAPPSREAHASPWWLSPSQQHRVYSLFDL